MDKEHSLIMMLFFPSLLTAWASPIKLKVVVVVVGLVRLGLLVFVDDLPGDGPLLSFDTPDTSCLSFLA